MKMRKRLIKEQTGIKDYYTDGKIYRYRYKFCFLYIVYITDV